MYIFRTLGALVQICLCFFSTYEGMLTYQKGSHVLLTFVVTASGTWFNDTFFFYIKRPLLFLMYYFCCCCCIK